MPRVLLIAVLVIGLAAFGTLRAGAAAGDASDTIVGTITVDGHNAPAGTIVSVMSLGETCDTQVYSGTVYGLTIDPTQGACWQPASQLRFLVGDRFADQVIRPPQLACTQLHLDLTVGGGQPATTLALPSIVVTMPCPMPVAGSASGGGGSSGGSSSSDSGGGGSGGCGSRGGPGYRLPSGKCASWQ